MEFFVTVLEFLSNVAAVFSIPTLIALLYCKFQAMKTKTTYSMKEFALDLFGLQRRSGEELLFKVMKWSCIAGLIASVALIFFVDNYEDKIFLAIKLISIPTALIAIYKW